MKNQGIIRGSASPVRGEVDLSHVDTMEPFRHLPWDGVQATKVLGRCLRGDPCFVGVAFEAEGFRRSITVYATKVNSETIAAGIDKVKAEHPELFIDTTIRIEQSGRIVRAGAVDKPEQSKKQQI